jgi:YNFM family putative membrane transporter
MTAFVTVFNYSGFRLIAPPYGLTETQISLIFTSYLYGIGSSPIAGALADRIGRGSVLIAGIPIAAAGVGLTLFHGLIAVIGGIVALAGVLLAAALMAALVQQVRCHHTDAARSPHHG